MILRPRQREFVSQSVVALKKHSNTLAIAPTGCGKTLMLSAVTKEIIGGNNKALILAHRDELTSQNRDKFLKINPHTSTSIFDAKEKSFDGQVTFAMVQTLCRENNLKLLPKIHLLVIDETHHATSESYQKVINRLKEINPNLLIYGVTATPNRGDKKSLSKIFSNVADQIKISELIASGHLVPPKTYIIDVGTVKSLKEVKRTAGDFDMREVEEIMNKSPINDAIIKHWQEKAGSRKTVIFCSTINHAISVNKSFNDKGIKSVLIHGNLTDENRKLTLDSFENKDAQVIVNVAVLTEGWDYQPTSCVVLLRPSSFKSTMIQMIGRGLRVIDQNLHPKIVKDDCVILDFGTSSLTHGCLEVDANLEVAKRKESQQSEPAPQKSCPECNSLIPIASNQCPLCEANLEERQKEEKEELTNFEMLEIDILTAKSNFMWCDLFGDESSFMATGFNAFAGVFLLEDNWYTIGSDNLDIEVLFIGKKQICLAKADDFLNKFETYENAHKSNKWLHQPASVKQINCLPSNYRNDFSLTKYKAAVLLKFFFNKKAIQELLFEVSKEVGGSES
jgi:superfamily II DNA or RNA helicase